MSILKFTKKKIVFIFTYIVIFGFFSSCGIYEKSDARKVSPNSKVRQRKNLEEGKGMTLKGLVGGSSGGTSYQFASSNPMWRATLDILDFLPLANVDYSGGIITTDWYNESTSAADEYIKITVRFLTNEIRSDGLTITIHKKRCNTQQNCSVKKIDSQLEQELKVAILKKAALFEKTIRSGKKKQKRGELKD